MTKAGWVLVGAAAAFGAGCTGAKSAQASHTAPPPSQAQGSAQADAGSSAHGMRSMMMQCPMAVPGTQVSSEDTPDGEAVVFTTSEPDQVPDLRARIHAMADRYERRHATGGTMPDGSGQGGAGNAGSAGSANPDAQAPSPAAAPSRAIVEDIEGGARITITPNDPADLEHLRAGIRDRVAYMQETGTCTMSSHGSHEDGARDEGAPDEVEAPQDQPAK